MCKLKYGIVSFVVIVLIASISTLPVILSTILDRSTYGESHLSEMKTIQMDLNEERFALTPTQKMNLIRQGTEMSVTESMATLTVDQVQEYVVNKLYRLEQEGLIRVVFDDLEMHTCEPVVYYDTNNVEHYNVFWIVSMATASPNQAIELLLDDSTGTIYVIQYSHSTEDVDEDVSITQGMIEHFAWLYFESLDIEYVIGDCYQVDHGSWLMKASCSDGERIIVVELALHDGGFHCMIY